MTANVTEQWTAHISTAWDVLGPFPIHAREQHFISPSFPLNLSEPVDLDSSWPSSYADGGFVSWSQFTSDASGRLKVSFPHIRWTSLRATEGWAALQHHSVLRTTLTVYPPEHSNENSTITPNLLVELKQGSFYTILPAEDTNAYSKNAFEWYSGNIYATEGSPPHIVRFPVPPSTKRPTKYLLYVSGDYEIRLFGDARSSGSETPVLDISISARLEIPGPGLVRDHKHDVVGDLVDGLSFGNALGIGLRSASEWWTVSSISPSPELQAAGLSLSLLRRMRFAPGQTRILPIELTQSQPFFGESLLIELTLRSGETTRILPVTINLVHRKAWSKSEVSAIRASYFYGSSIPSHFLVLPPKEPNAKRLLPRPPILALHGAGVDIISMPFWATALPRQSHSWVIMPIGRTPWGLDWHGPSAQDAWQSVEALSAILEQTTSWRPWKLAPDTKVVVIGHSNGGQGAWYLASRFPDRVVAAIPAAGYIKAQAYVPLTQSRSAHFIDPSLRAILEASFTPDDNDLFLSNLVDTPILAIHGGEDDNVPTWHTREAVSIVKSWRADADITYKEDPGERHWYPFVFDNSAVQTFLDTVSSEHTAPPRGAFTLTVASPAECGSLHGWRILSLEMPGRLARLKVTLDGEVAVIKTTNVNVFSLDLPSTNTKVVIVDGIHLRLQTSRGVATPAHHFLRSIADGWITCLPEFSVLTCRQLRDLEIRPESIQRSHRLHTILQSSGPILLVVPDNSSSSRELAIAQRIAHDLFLFHNLDAEILLDSEALQSHDTGDFETGNIIAIGTPHSRYIRRNLRESQGVFQIAHGPDSAVLQLRGKPLNETSQGVIFSHPHPAFPSASMLFLIGNDEAGLERVARLFPIRTGVSLPDWLVIGQSADSFGAAGVQGAGIWDEHWGYNNAISWHD
ncbi:hypothetical protein BV25DRAFT_1974045 [Artomyces pyxidatus]|uniref:Uncharacterized protein n=1 Tax=Artomyces pyxidatus TaxID=48021 RepID=A0ACB8SLP2_9AGAM|nr:hypothetical protein BV25DRAFT_1974045 [Artomyces pyxidatus]